MDFSNQFRHSVLNKFKVLSLVIKSNENVYKNLDNKNVGQAPTLTFNMVNEDQR